MANVFSLDPNRAARINDTAEQLVQSKQLCGVAWQFAQNDQILSNGETGFLDKPGGIPLPTDALYRIYSMTKPLVSVLALQLIEEGKLRLSDPVAIYLPALANPTVLQSNGQEQAATHWMTVEHLLTHRAGFSYDFLPNCEIARRYQSAQLVERGDRTLEQFVDALAEIPLAFEPGTQWRYSVCTDVLARLLEVVTGDSLTELLERRLFAPCGMKDTAFYVPIDKQDRLATLYGSRLLGQVPGLPELPQKLETLDAESSHPIHSPDVFARGGHGLYSTTQDYAQFLPVLMSGLTANGERILSPAMVDMMWADRIPAHQQPLYIGVNPMPGYGWNLTGRVMINTGASLGLTLPNEGGWGGAAATYFFVHRETGLSGVVMTQYIGSAIPIGDDLRVAFLQALQY